MTVEHYYEKSEVLPVEYRKWFDLPLLKFESLHIKPLQNWIEQTKILFKSHKINFNKENKITNYFQMESKLNDKRKNMGITNTISETNIRTQYNRNGSTYKGSETINTNKI